jgi:hypothetical protein
VIEETPEWMFWAMGGLAAFIMLLPLAVTPPPGASNNHIDLHLTPPTVPTFFGGS